VLRGFRKRRPRAVETLILERDLPAPPGPVFAAFTTAEALMCWMQPFETEVVAVQIDFETGNWFKIELAGRHGRWTIAGKYLEVEAPRRLRFSWTSPVTFDRPSIVTLTLVGLGADASQTRLELVHERLPGALVAERHETMWAELLGRLADYLAEAGVATRSSAPD